MAEYEIQTLEGKVQFLIGQIGRAEKEACRKLGANPDDWLAPSLTFVEEFHQQCDPWQATHPQEYQKQHIFALQQQISILKTQLRIAKEICVSLQG